MTRTKLAPFYLRHGVYEWNALIEIDKCINITLKR